MRFAIIGAGGVGGYYGGILARAGHDVRVLARGEHLRAVAADGLRIETPDETFDTAVTAAADREALGAVDVAIVAVKAFALDEVAPILVDLARAGSVVLPLLNGVDAGERLAAAGVPPGRLLTGLTYISARRVAPGHIRRASPFHRVLVDAQAPVGAARVRDVVQAFAGAGCEAAAAEDIQLELWRKFIFIAALAAACGLARATIGGVRDARLGADLLDRAVAEVAAVARARGVGLPADEEQRVRAHIDRLPAAMEPSFLVDVRAGGPNELDALSGAVSRFGRAAGVATPVHDTAVAARSAV